MTTTAFTNGVTLTDAAWFNDVDTATYPLTSVSGTNTITATGPSSLSAYASGQVIKFIPAATNSGATTINVSGLGAKNVFANGSACTGGELVIGVPNLLYYDGTQFNIVGYQRAASSTVVRGAIAGLTMSTAGASTTMTVAAGQAADSTNASYMTLGSSMGKTTSGWTAGTGNGGLDTGSIANSTWYHFYLIAKADGTTDVTFSTNATTPSLPSGYTLYRRIGSGKTNGSAQWILFKQNGDRFKWDVGVNDVAAAVNPGTSAVTRTLTVPTGIVVDAWLDNSESNQSNNRFVLWTALDQTDTTPSITNNTLNAQGTNTARFNAEIYVKTNTSAQVRYRTNASGASDETNVVTVGWIDSRGRND